MNMISDELHEQLIDERPARYTRLRPALCARQQLGDRWVSFYQCVITLEEAAKELKLVENLPSDLRSKWKLEELFQREIDWERVENEIVNGYLRRPEKLKFFNSLTVALLPVDEKKMLASEYGETPHAPDLKDAFKKAPWEVVNAGGVQIVRHDKTSHGYFRWDPKRIFPATIDGQHRLASLQKIYNDGNLPSVALETKLSVIFLVLDPRAGFDITKLNLAQEENPILTVVREVFIDLNLHS